MKVLLMIFVSFYFLGCGKGSKKSETMNGVGFGGSETMFTITHNDSEGSESLFIYLDDKGSSISNVDMRVYQVSPGACFSLTQDHFSYLNIKTFYTGRSKTLCGTSDENKCQAGNYNINNEPSYGFDNYELKATDQASSSDSCINIEDWMKSNTPINKTSPPPS